MREGERLLVLLLITYHSSLNPYLYPPVLYHDLVGLDGLGGAVEAGARAHVEEPAVPGAFDGVAAQFAVGEGRALVRAEVLDGVESAADVVEREFAAVLKPDRRERARALGPPGV